MNGGSRKGVVNIFLVLQWHGVFQKAINEYKENAWIGSLEHSF